jgi:hypothetical protein
MVCARPQLVEKVKREARPMTDLRQLQNITFTTQPKTRKHLTRGAFISGTRAAQFMQHLWDAGLKKSCSYETLKWEFVNCFGTNDTRTVERYIGRPEQTIRSKEQAEKSRYLTTQTTEKPVENKDYLKISVTSHSNKKKEPSSKEHTS